MNDTPDIPEQTEYTESDLMRIGRSWIERIDKAEERERKWIKEAEAADAAYLCIEDTEQGGDARNPLPYFNILHSNVETIVPAILNSQPRPDIRPRHNNQDDAMKWAANFYERAIMANTDDNVMDEEGEMTAQDTFMAGRGITRVRFDADEFERVTMQPVMNDMGMPAVDEQGMPVLEEVVEDIMQNERVLYENVSWKDYREGPAKRWRDVPWVAFRHEFSEDEKARIEDEDLTSVYTNQPDLGDEVNEDLVEDAWEIWCKDTGKVYFVMASSAKVIAMQDDPLGLKEFFPVPKPVQPITGSGRRTPTCPYSVYKVLADEMDTATKRINAIMKGLRVRGIVVGDAQIMVELSKAADNELVPVQNIESLVAAGGLEKAVLWWPVEQAIAVLVQLYQQREQSKQAIFELTGISDIVRGAGQASETATAQRIKAEWGSLRVRKMQRMIERHFRDLFVLTAEIMGKHFSIETMQKLAGMQVPPEMAQMVQTPLDHYRIDIESDSTVRADLTKSRGEMTEFLQGTAQFFQTMAPIVAQAPATAEPLAIMYQSFATQFQLGKDAEDALDQFVDMARQAGNAAQNKQDPEAQKAMAEMQFKMKELEAKMQQAAQEAMQDAELKREQMALDATLKREEMALKQQDQQFGQQTKVAELQIKREGKGEGTQVYTGSMPPDELAEAFAGALTALSEQLQAGQQSLAQGQQALAAEIQQSNQAIVAAMTAPKEVLRDENGRPVGVQTRMQ